MWAETFQLTTTSEVTSAYVRVSQNTDSDSALEQLDHARTKKLMGLNMDLMPLNDYTIQEFNWNYKSNGSTYDATGCDNTQCLDNFSAAVEDYRTQLVAAWIESGCLWSGEDCPLPPIPFQFGAIYPPTGGGGTTGGKADAAWAGGNSFAYTAAPQFHAGVTGQSATTIPIHEMQHNIGPAQGWCDWFIDDNGNGVSDFPDECTVFGGYGPGEWGEHLSTTGVQATDDCGAGGQDSVWISIYGSTGKPFDIKDLGWNHNNVDPETNQDALVPSSYPDLMTYCIAVTSSEIAARPSFLTETTKYHTSQMIIEHGCQHIVGYETMITFLTTRHGTLQVEHMLDLHQVWTVISSELWIWICHTTTKQVMWSKISAQKSLLES